jgi:DNA-binding response OmpR family regulator
MRILLVEDDLGTVEFVSKALTAEGYSVDDVADGHEALRMLERTPYDGVVLDIMLTGRDGIGVLRQMRSKGNATPVLILSARSDVSEKVEGLNAGAEDYVAKPFALAELVARVRALLRRSGKARTGLLRVADLTLDPVSRTAARNGRRIDLTNREFRLLEYLMRAEGSVCSRMLILEAVWEYDFDPGTNIVDVFIAKLRDKIDSGSAVKLLHSVRREGYVIKAAP